MNLTDLRKKKKKKTIPLRRVFTRHPYVQEVTRRSSESHTRFSSKLAVSVIKPKLEEGRVASQGRVSTKNYIFNLLGYEEMIEEKKKKRKKEGISGAVITESNCWDGVSGSGVPKRCR